MRMPWEPGKSLTESGYAPRKVMVYRALPASDPTLHHGNYITLSLKFAKGHAQHMAVTEEEDQVVVGALVPSQDVVGAKNTDEYLYMSRTSFRATKVLYRALAGSGDLVRSRMASKVASEFLERKASLRSVSQIGEGKFRKIMAQFPNAEAFAESNLQGFGAKGPGDIAGFINRASDTRLDMGKVRRELAIGGSWYFLHKVPVTWVNAKTHGDVAPSGLEDLSKPIVVGARGHVLDGRHRVAFAKEKGLTELPAFIPAKLLYQMMMGR